MKLHDYKDDFTNLSIIVSQKKSIPALAIKRDYYIVLMLSFLAKSDMVNQCVLKGGTSLSKCYPNSINRFSEDIDLTFIPKDDYSNNSYDKLLKKIERIMTNGMSVEKIESERNYRNKSSWVWNNAEDKDKTKIKLEIGSSIVPFPYGKKFIKSYIHEYLEEQGLYDAIGKYELHKVEINALSIERTFLDKVMAVKRHAICGTLINKVRHIYDVVMLFYLEEIRQFLSEKEKLKDIIRITKETDSYYLQKRNIPVEYNPLEKYDFLKWKKYFDNSIRQRYESLHEDLLFTNEKQDFNRAIAVFEEISSLFESIGE